jgi:hypothetical protein
MLLLIQNSSASYYCPFSVPVLWPGSITIFCNGVRGFSFQQQFQILVAFMTLIILRITGLEHYRMSHILGFSQISLMIRLWLWVLRGSQQRSFLSIISKYMLMLITVNALFNHLVEVLLTVFFYCKVTFILV